MALTKRRKFGAYFTGTKLSELLLAKCESFDDERTFYDPTCGMGDLLYGSHKLTARWDVVFGADGFDSIRVETMLAPGG